MVFDVYNNKYILIQMNEMVQLSRTILEIILMAAVTKRNNTQDIIKLKQDKDIRKENPRNNSFLVTPNIKC